MRHLTADAPIGYGLTPAGLAALSAPPARSTTAKLLDAAHSVHHLTPEVAELLRAAISHVDSADGWEAEGLAHAAVLGALSGTLMRCENAGVES